MRAPMPKKYRLQMAELNDAGEVIRESSYTDYGYWMSRELKRLAKQINEPAPVVKLEGQTEMDIP